MPRATLIVHRVSFSYVANFVHYLHGMLRRIIDRDACLIICDEIDDEAYTAGIVFVIGENLPPFRRREGCSYVYLNFSVVTLLGNPLSAGLNGYRQVHRKRGLMLSKLPGFDALLDYYPAQTRLLQKRLPIPVFGFDVAVPPSDQTEISTRPFDICFVGGITSRRRHVLEELEGKGFVLSPNSGGAIEIFATKARCCLNIHAERSNHLEIPRIVGALSSACPLVTENSHGLAELCEGSFVETFSYSSLVSGVSALLSDPCRLQAHADQAHNWYREVYLPRADRRWTDLLAKVTELPRLGRVAG